MFRQATIHFSKGVGLFSAAMLAICLLFFGADANAARPDVRQMEASAVTRIASPACFDCIVLKQHRINPHRCTHGAHARFVFNLLRSSQRVVGGAPNVSFERTFSSTEFDIVAQAAGRTAQAGRFDETFKSIYAKTRRMQP